MLDPDYIHRAAPPGSMRYFALLYSPMEHRQILAALFVIDSEIRASVKAAHEVAHTRMQWWRAEIDRLINRNAQHPATQALQAALPKANFAVLHDLLAAADMDLARMTYNTRQELERYLDLSGGSIFALDERAATHSDWRDIGKILRRVETLRDLIMDWRIGRIYWPLDELTANAIPPEVVPEGAEREKFLLLLTEEARTVSGALRQCPLPNESPFARPLAVLVALHEKIAWHIARDPASVFAERHELGPLQKVWTAWRAARRT